MENHPRLDGRKRSPLPFVAIGALVAVFAGVMLTRPHAHPSPDPSVLMKERLAALRHGLATYRSMHANHGPASLGDLVKQRAMRDIPLDPVTQSRTTWRVDTEERVAVANDFGPAGGSDAKAEIVAVHSGARGTDAHGRAWSDY